MAGMRKDIYKFTIFFLMLFILVSGLIGGDSDRKMQEEKEVPRLHADINIRSSFSWFGNDINFLDINNDQVIDLLIGRGDSGARTESGLLKTEDLFLFDGRKIKPGTVLDTEMASLRLMKKTRGIAGRTPNYLRNLHIGDFNGDDYHDLIMKTSLSYYSITLGSSEFFEKLGEKRIDRTFISKETNAGINVIDDCIPDAHASSSSVVVDLNRDDREDIVFTCTMDDFRLKHFNAAHTGVIQGVWGKEIVGTDSDLHMKNDWSIHTIMPKTYLGYHILLFQNGQQSSEYSMFIAGRDRVYVIPNTDHVKGTCILCENPAVAAQMEEQWGVSSIPNTFHFLCDGENTVLHAGYLNNNDKIDLLVSTPYPSEFMKKNDPVRYEAFKKDNRYPLLSIIYDWEGLATSGQHIDDLADYIFYFTPGRRGVKKAEIVFWDDMDMDGNLDIVFHEKMYDGEDIHFIYNFEKAGKKILLDELVDITLSRPEEPSNYIRPFLNRCNFNGNNIPDYVASHDSTDIIYVYMDRIFNQEFLQKLEGTEDIIIEIDDKFSFPTHKLTTTDLDRDGLDDIVILCPFFSCVSICYGKSLKEASEFGQ